MKIDSPTYLSFVFLLICIFIFAESSIYTYSTCSSISIFNSKTLQCDLCPNNSTANLAERIPSSCICLPGYININGQSEVCSKISLTCNDMQIYDVYNIDGSINSPGNCVDCDVNAYPNK
jgi:hypothetical protein